MSLNKKYTWADFLKEHPEHKEKKIKRTSKEGQKAFEAAFKQHSKNFLKDRLSKIENEKKRASEKRKSLNKNLKNFGAKIGSADAYLNKLEKDTERVKDAQKHI